MTNCSRLLSCQILSLKGSTKGCRFFSSERNSHENASSLQLRTTIEVNKSFFFLWETMFVLSHIHHNTHTHTQTDSQQFALCPQNWVRWQKMFTFQETAEH